MSGMRGKARKGRTKVRVKIRFCDSGKIVTTNIFAPIGVSAIQILFQIERKYGKEVELLAALNKEANQHFTQMSLAQASVMAAC